MPRALGLDPDEIARRFKAEAAEVNRRTELAFPAPVPERGMPAGALMLLGVVLAVGAYAGWYRLSGEGRLPAETVHPGARASRAAGRAGGAAIAPPPAGQPARCRAAGGCRPRLRRRQPGAGRSAGRRLLPFRALGDAPVPVSPTSAAAAPMPPMPVTPAAARRPAAHRAAGDRRRLGAGADRTGNVLLNRSCTPANLAGAGAADLVLTTGNAGGTELVVDGVATAGRSAAPARCGATCRWIPT